MIVSAQIRFKNVLKMLDVESIPGCDDDPADWIDFLDCVDVDEDDLPKCEMCGGEGYPEPEPAVDPNLIRDFVAAINAGDLHTARCLVGRVFTDADDITLVDTALCRCAA